MLAFDDFKVTDTPKNTPFWFCDPSKVKDGPVLQNSENKFAQIIYRLWCLPPQLMPRRFSWCWFTNTNPQLQPSRSHTKSRIAFLLTVLQPIKQPRIGSVSHAAWALPVLTNDFLTSPLLAPCPRHRVLCLRAVGNTLAEPARKAPSALIQHSDLPDAPWAFKPRP